MQAARLRDLIKEAVKEGMQESPPYCSIFKEIEIQSMKNVIKIEQRVKGWILYSIALGIAAPGWLAAGFVILRILKVI